MAAIKPYPHFEINVKDNSIYTVTYEEILPVHRALWVMKAQEGPCGEPTWCGTFSEAKAIFGAETFKPANKLYFSPQAQFLLETLTYNGAFICRAADGGSEAQIILEAWVKDAEITQYQLDDDGNRVVDENGDYIPMMNGDTEVTEAGVEITFRTRTELTAAEIAADVDIDDLDKNGTQPYRTEGDYKIYPILAVRALYPGLYGNDLAFSLFYKAGENKSGDVDFFNTVFYSFAPVRREYASTTVSPLYDKYNRTFETFAANPDTIDPDNNVQYSLENMLNRGYDAEGKQLPYTIYTYEDSFKLIGNLIISKEKAANSVDCLANISTEDLTDPEFDANTSDLGYKVNVITGYNVNKQPYKHVKIVTAADSNTANPVAILSSNSVIYLDGGSDGNLDDVMVETAVRQLCAKKLNPQIVDKFKYPITHMYDPGFSMKTKYAMLDFLDVRDDIMVELSTQVLFDDGSGRSISANDQATDEANGEALRSYALLMRESVLMGTDCCRCAIYCHAARLAKGTYTAYLPMTYWSAVKHAKFGRTQYMSVDEPRGWPESYNEMFKVASFEWINYDPEGQSRVWDSGLNYLQYADRKRLFYPALRTVYRAETSVLVDQWFVDAVVYTKHVVRKAWAKHSGRNDRAAVIQQAIKDYLDAELGALYCGKYDFVVTVYQTEEEKKIGYIQHVKISITSPATMRVLDVDIEVNREGFNPEE